MLVMISEKKETEFRERKWTEFQPKALAMIGQLRDTTDSEQLKEKIVSGLEKRSSLLSQIVDLKNKKCKRSERRELRIELINLQSRNILNRLVALCCINDHSFADRLFGNGDTDKKSFYLMSYGYEASEIIKSGEIEYIYFSVSKELYSLQFEDFVRSMTDTSRGKNEIHLLFKSIMSIDPDMTLGEVDMFRRLSQLSDNNEKFHLLDLIGTEDDVVRDLKISLLNNQEEAFINTVLKSSIKNLKFVKQAVTAWWILHKLKVNMIWKEEVDIRPLDSILHETRTFEERASEYLEIFGPEEKDMEEATKDKIYKFAARFKYPSVYLPLYNGERYYYVYNNRILQSIIWLHLQIQCMLGNTATVNHVQNRIDEYENAKEIERSIKESNYYFPKATAIDVYESFMTHCISSHETDNQKSIVEPTGYKQSVADSFEDTKDQRKDCYSGEGGKRTRKDMEILYYRLIEEGYIKETSTLTLQSFLYYLAEDYLPSTDIERQPIRWLKGKTSLYTMIERLCPNDNKRWAKTHGTKGEYRNFFENEEGIAFSGGSEINSTNNNDMNRIIDDLFADKFPETEGQKRVKEKKIKK